MTAKEELVTLDISGQTSYVLVAQRPTGRIIPNKGKEWECVCACGKTRYVSASEFKLGIVKSCGCIRFYKDTPLRKEQKERTLERARRIANEIAAGRKMTEMAKEEGVSTERIRQLWSLATEGMPSPRTQRNKERWTPENIALLGTLPDKEIAERLECSSSSVCTKRRQLGIARIKRGRRFLDAPKVNHVGEKHGRLRIIGWERLSGDRGFGWICRCKCGKVTAPGLYSNVIRTKSCGCLVQEYYNDRIGYIKRLRKKAGIS